jgi:hypothetical protein
MNLLEESPHPSLLPLPAAETVSGRKAGAAQVWMRFLRALVRGLAVGAA